MEESKTIKVGMKKSASYIDYIKNNPAKKLVILARGSLTSKAVYVAGVIKNTGYTIENVDIETLDLGKKEPLVTLRVEMAKEA